MQKSAILLVTALVFCLGTPSGAGEPPSETVSTDLQSLSDAELDRRIQWLEQTLDAQASWAKKWQYGWTTGYSSGIGIGAAQAITTSDSETRASGIVTASKSVIGTTKLLLDPHPARLGADPMRDVQGDDRDAKIRRLMTGEAHLLEIADRASKRHHWKRHAGNVVLNLIGGAIILGVGEEKSAAISAGLGIAVGEAMIFTSPKSGVEDLRMYETKIGQARSKSRFTYHLAPTPNGAALHVTF